jgi:hypothetical protein
VRDDKAPILGLVEHYADPALGAGRRPDLAARTVRRPTARAPEPGRQKEADAAHACEGVRDGSGALGFAVPSLRLRTAARHEGVPAFQ